MIHSEEITPVFSTILEGRVMGKQRPRTAKSGHTYTPRETVQAEKDIVKQIRVLLPYSEPPTHQAFGVDLEFRIKDFRRTDIDNAVKLVLDAMNKIVWADDAQVVQVNAKIARNTGLEDTSIMVYYLPDIAVKPLHKPRNGVKAQR